MKIVLLTKYNPYWAYQYFAEQLNLAFRRQGYESQVLDFDDDEPEFTKCLLRNEPTLFISFIAFIKQTSLLDLLLPMHKWLFFRLDPIEFSKYAVFPHDKFYVSIVDKFECAYTQTFLQPDHVQFIPHAADPFLTYDENLARPMDVLFCATSYDHKTIEKKINTLEPNERKFIYECIEKFRCDPTIIISQLVLECPPSLRTKYHSLIDSYIRAKDRYDLISSIKDAQIHLYGGTGFDSKEFPVRGWAQILQDQPNVSFYPGIRFTETIDLMRNSKIVLNSMPFFKNGTHERVFNSLALGALPLTNKNIWFNEHFEDGKELVFYDLPKVNDQVNDLLANEEKRKEIVREGCKKVLRDHIWDRRADQIINWLIK